MHIASHVPGISKMLQVRNVPDDVQATLRRRATAAGMPLSEYSLRQLTAAAARPTLDEVFARGAADLRPGGRMAG